MNRVLLLLVLAIAPQTVAQSTRNPLALSERAPTSIEILRPGEPEREPVSDVPMAHLVAGRIATLDRNDSAALARAVAPTSGVEDEPEAWLPLYRVLAQREAEFRGALIGRDAESAWWLRSIPDGQEHARFWRLSDQRMEQLSADWPAYRGGFDPEEVADPIGEVFDIDPPFTPSPIILDDKTLKDRCYKRMRVRSPSTDVDLPDERFAARLPRNYDPRKPAGLIVWVTPQRGWTVPRELHPALDELNFVAIGAPNSENERQIPDRLQLALHAAQIASSRWHIDPRRVYVTGMSGGGKMTSMLWACFPDVFRGGIPIVGLASYKDEPVPGGEGAYYPALFSKPAQREFALLRQHRLAPISGPPDFNYVPMQQCTKGMLEDRLALRFFEDPELAHTMPKPALFLEALRWVDEPYAELRAAEAAAAQAALEAYTSEHADAAPQDDEQREALADVMQAGPWTNAAWAALELLSR